MEENTRELLLKIRYHKAMSYADDVSGCMNQDLDLEVWARRWASAEVGLPVLKASSLGDSRIKNQRDRAEPCSLGSRKLFLCFPPVMSGRGGWSCGLIYRTSRG